MFELQIFLGQLIAKILHFRYVFMYLKGSEAKFDSISEDTLASGLIILFQSLNLVSKLQIT